MINGMKYGAIYADPPWSFKTWSAKGQGKSAENHYQTLSIDDMCTLPVQDMAANDCVLFMWICWPQLPDALCVIDAWGFKYKTCGFAWVKADPQHPDKPRMGMGYWTRSNSEVCLLATRGKPKRLHADVRQAIIEPAREHSRKPDAIRERIQRLVAGPYLEMFARTETPGWDTWGNETNKFPIVEGPLS